MDDAKELFWNLRFPVFLVCDDKQPKGFRLVGKSKCFRWGGEATLVDTARVLIFVTCCLRLMEKKASTWNVLGANGKSILRVWASPSEGKYATHIPVRHVMNSVTDE